jgi:hypothetical protein
LRRKSTLFRRTFSPNKERQFFCIVKFSQATRCRRAARKNKIVDAPTNFSASKIAMTLTLNQAALISSLFIACSICRSAVAFKTCASTCEHEAAAATVPGFSRDRNTRVTTGISLKQQLLRAWSASAMR